MLTPPHRITLYWLLLLLPTLAVGAGALALLRREQARLDEQAEALTVARVAAIEARARLIAENVELLVGDAQAALMATLREVPRANPDRFLDEWEQNNRLVGVTFRISARGDLLRPDDGNTVDWLTRWWASLRTPQLRKSEPQTFAAAEADRGAVSENVAQVQSARSALQDEARQRRPEPRAAAAVPTVAPEGPGRWMPWREEGELHLVGWRTRPTGEVIGVELDLAAVVARLDALLPKEGELADAFVLREAGGRTLKQKIYASVSRSAVRLEGEPAVTVPIAAGVLPGWEVVAFVPEVARPGGAGRAFFVVGALLVAIFVSAILSGGALLRAQARRSEQEAAQKTSFVANVSHEFKTPLTTIRLYAELLEQGRVRDAAQGADYLRTIGRETQRLARLVNNALDFSRLEQGRKQFARESVELRAFVTQLLDTHAPRVAEAGLALERVLPEQPLTATVDRDALEQVVLNVIDNACKYAASGAELRIALHPGATGGPVLEVADRGPGVPVEHRERIFAKFHRVDEALTAEKSGAGLGLSIARQLARGMGAELRYAARDGGGSVFILELP